eukprot:gene12245-23237_t
MMKKKRGIEVQAGNQVQAEVIKKEAVKPGKIGKDRKNAKVGAKKGMEVVQKKAAKTRRNRKEQKKDGKRGKTGRVDKDVKGKNKNVKKAEKVRKGKKKVGGKGQQKE